MLEENRHVTCICRVPVMGNGFISARFPFFYILYTSICAFGLTQACLSFNYFKWNSY